MQVEHSRLNRHQLGLYVSQAAPAREVRLAEGLVLTPDDAQPLRSRPQQPCCVVRTACFARGIISVQESPDPSLGWGIICAMWAMGSGRRAGRGSRTPERHTHTAISFTTRGVKRLRQICTPGRRRLSASGGRALRSALFPGVGETRALQRHGWLRRTLSLRWPALSPWSVAYYPKFRCTIDCPAYLTCCPDCLASNPTMPLLRAMETAVRARNAAGAEKKGPGTGAL